MRYVIEIVMEMEMRGTEMIARWRDGNYSKLLLNVIDGCATGLLVDQNFH